MDKEATEKMIQKVLPSFSISGEVGRGAFGAVYKIKDELKERVAKIVQLDASAGIENGTVVSAEAKIERDFRHIVDSYERIACDEIVTVYDFYMVRPNEEETGAAYAVIIMEIYPMSLDGYVVGHYEKTGGPLDIMVAGKLMEKVALMLGNLYEKMGFLFEDFKPENLLVKEHQGDLKVVVGDIGGLKNVVSIAMTASQVTPTYCAPEVLRKAQPPDMRSIVYSFGLLCFYILEGHLPYDDKGVSARLDLVKDQGLPFSRTDIPDTMKRVIEKCLVFEADQRYSRFDDVVQGFRGQAPSAPATGEGDDFANGTIVVGGAGPGASQDFSSSTITVGVPGAPAPPGAPGTAPPGKTVPLGRKPATRRMPAGGERKSSLDSVSIKDEKEHVSKIENEIAGRVIRKGEAFKLSNDSYRVMGNIVVHSNAILNIVGAKLYFAENAGIIVLGAIRTKDSVFSAIDTAKKWNNMTIFSTARSGVSVIDNCRFHFGKGISGKSLMENFNITRPSIQGNGFYGGGLFVAGGTEKTLTMKKVTCYKCSAHEGGGMYFHKSKISLEGGLFEGCTAINSGGGVSSFESNCIMKGCMFNKCSAGKDGGGICLQSSNPDLEDSMLIGCISRYNGGGVACIGSSPNIKNCRFERCISKKTGGGIYGDRTSNPTLAYPSYSKCKPNDSNL
jgi:hypothetical protein